jgi:uncharacterized protein YwgA
MTTLCREELDSASRKALMVVLSLEDRTKKCDMDIVHIQKTVRFFQYLSERNDIDYSNFNYGAVSEELEDNLESLQEYGYVEEHNGTYALTEEGKACIKDVASLFSKEDLRKLMFAKKQLGDLEFEELLFFMYKVLPETTENSTVYSQLLKKRIPLTISLFEKGVINAETAAKWLNMTEKEFLGYLSKQNAD